MKTYSDKATMYYWRAADARKQGKEKQAALYDLLRWHCEYRSARERLSLSNRLDKYRRRAAMIHLNKTRHAFYNAGYTLKMVD